MITSLAQHIAVFLLKKEVIDGKKLDIYIYGFEVMISSILNILIALLIGLAFSQLIECVVFLVVFIYMRKYCGGYHSVFTWSKSGTKASVSIQNTTKTTRKAQVNAYGYDAYGNYVGFISNEGNIGDSKTLSKSGTIAGAESITFGGNLYSSTMAVGTPLSHWSRSIG